MEQSDHDAFVEAQEYATWLLTKLSMELDELERAGNEVQSEGFLLENILEELDGET